MSCKSDGMRRASRLRRRDGVVAIIEFMEVGIGEPSFIEMQNFDCISHKLLDGIGIVAKAVIGGVGHHHQANPAIRVLGERAGIYLVGEWIPG